MAVIRDYEESDFVQIPNSLARDHTMSLKARGLLVDLLSRPHGWQVHMNELVASCKEGRTAVTTAMDELIEAGYVKRVQNTDNYGRFTTVDYLVRSKKYYITPQAADVDFPRTEIPRTETPLTENKPLQIQMIRKTEETKTEESDATHQAKPKINDGLFTAIASAVGLTGHITKSEGAQIGRAVRELRELGATPDDVAARSTVFRQRYPKWELTVWSLLNKWSQLGTTTATPKPQTAYVDPLEETRKMWSENNRRKRAEQKAQAALWESEQQPWAAN